MSRACSTNVKKNKKKKTKKDAYRILVEKPEGKRQVERPKRTREDKIETELGEVGFGGMDWIDPA
jgi:hypothetical protein